MIDFLLAEFNTGFTIALGIVLAIAIMEGLGVIIGLSIVNLVDQLSPFDIDVDIDTDISSGGLTSLVGWLYLDRMPLLVWLILLLSGFAIAGYSVNYFTINLFGTPFNSVIVYCAAIILAIAMTRLTGGPISRLMPQNESSAISNTSFAGKIARITVGTARIGSPAEAMLSDEFKQKHYVLVAPDQADIEFKQGQEVVLVEKLESHWIGMTLTR